MAYFKEDGVFDLRKIFDLRKFFAVPKNFLKSKIHCTRTAWLAHYLLTMKAESLDPPLHVATACQKEAVFKKLKSLLV